MIFYHKLLKELAKKLIFPLQPTSPIVYIKLIFSLQLCISPFVFRFGFCIISFFFSAIRKNHLHRSWSIFFFGPCKVVILLSFKNSDYELGPCLGPQGHRTYNNYISFIFQNCVLSSDVVLWSAVVHKAQFLWQT